jgi:hypothetical protein
LTVKVGITGHQRLRASSSWQWVREQLDAAIAGLARPLTGISSLAIGADQLFAKLVIERGGQLYAVLPFEGYEAKFTQAEHLRTYLDLLNSAARVETLDALRSEEESYLAAGKHVSDISDTMIAVWDGKAAAGLGGTADVVRYASRLGKTVIHINPDSREVRVLGT